MSTDVQRSQLVVKGKYLEYLTLSWNMLEAAVAIGAGIVAGSIALVGFGLDSVIECLSGGVLLWRLHTDADQSQRERRETTARRLVGVGFLILAAYIVTDVAYSLLSRERPEHSIAGIVLACASLVVMPLLARAKRKVAAALESGALHADSRQTDICAYLSAILVGGLILNALLGWWWADPIAALVMVPIVAREGVEALRGNSCGCVQSVDLVNAVGSRCGCTDSSTGEQNHTCRGCSI